MAKVGLFVNVSLNQHTPADVTSAWIDLPESHESEVMEFHLAHIPPGLTKEGRLPDCYFVVSFWARIHESQVDEAEDTQVRKRHFFPQPTSCDDHNDVVIGLAVGLGVAGGLFVCATLLCIAVASFQQYRVRNSVGGSGGGGDVGGGGFVERQDIKEFNDEGLDYEDGGGRGARAVGGINRKQAATAQRSMGRYDVEVNVPELGQASPRAGRQVNKATDAMSHLREVDEVEMQSVQGQGTNLPAPLW